MCTVVWAILVMSSMFEPYENQWILKNINNDLDFFMDYDEMQT